MTDLDSLITGLISFSLLKDVSFQEVCFLPFVKYVPIHEWFKIIKRNFKKLFVLNKILFFFFFFFLSTRSLLRMPI